MVLLKRLNWSRSNHMTVLEDSWMCKIMSFFKDWDLVAAVTFQWWKLVIELTYWGKLYMIRMF